METSSMKELLKTTKNRDKIVEEIVKIEKKFFPKHESLAKSFHDELNKKNSGLLYVEVDGEVAGYVMYSWSHGLLPYVLILTNLQENYERRGLGEALLISAIQKCRTRNVQRVSLHVDPLRAPALNLYKKLGFQVDELIEGYYSSERNAYRMYLEFNDI